MISLLLNTLVFCSAAKGFPLPEAFLPVPHDDPFYSGPTNLESLQLGQIYNRRQVFPQLEITGAKAVEQVAYRTTDAMGNASYTVATVFTPWNPDPDAKLLSVQVWEDSDNIDCSPSYSFYGGIATPDGSTVMADNSILIDWALSHGYYVVAPDHEGPKSSFFAGFTEGHAGLDGIRAALEQLQLPGDTQVALYGYSGGAHATVWMTDLADGYAPELNIVGAAHGGTPVDPKGTLEFLDGKQFSGFVLGAIAGMMTAYPQLKEDLWPHIDATIKNDLETMWSDNTCVDTEALRFGDTTYHTMTSLPDFYTFPPIAKVLENESLLTNVSSHAVSTPKFPRYIYHAEHDEIIPNSLAKQYVSQQCSNGANIQFVEWPGGDHVSTLVSGFLNTLQFLQQAFEGKTPQVACGTPAKDILTMDTVGVGSVIGEGIYDAIAALDNMVTPLGKIILDPEQNL